MHADVGPVGEDGADTFSFDVCAPRALKRRFDIERRPFWARGTLVVDTFSWEAVDAALKQSVRSVSGEDWNEIATKLNRLMHWEFDDYRPHGRLGVAAAFAAQPRAT